MIVRSVFTVPCPSCCAPLALTLLPSFLGKMAVFDKTDSLVMNPVQRFHCCRQDRRACGRQHRRDEPSAMGWNERCVVLLSHEYALGRACQVRRLLRMTTRSCSRGTAWSGRNGQSLKFNHIRFEHEPNADVAHDENELLDKKELLKPRFLT